MAQTADAPSPAPDDAAVVTLRAGWWRAAVRRRGGSLGDLRCGDRHVIQAGPADVPGPGAHGAVLVPWPNRLDGGRYEFAGVEHRLAIDEPAKDNAIHGLGRDRSWTLVAHETARAEVRLVLGSDEGYPFPLEVTVAYDLADDGLTVTTTARNLGTTPCPYGVGHHPYLSPGAGPVDAAVVQLDASTFLTTDDRQLPVGRASVDGTPFDLRRPVRLGPRRIDHAFTDLARDREGRAWAHLTGTDGSTVSLWADRAHPVLQVYTADHSDRLGLRRGALAVEPMTCPANALRTGDHLVVLDPGAESVSTWGLTLTDP